MESKKNKSRNLSPYQLFQILQEEWLVADLRSRIYPQKKDKEYWNKVKEGKRKTIEQIADKNHLYSTIFTDEEMMRFFQLKIYKDKGFPSLSYKDQANKEIQEPFDLAYYFSFGAEIRFEAEGEQRVGTIKSYTPYEKEILIAYQDKSIVLPIGEVTRIL